jgi:hypothetical protein
MERGPNDHMSPEAAAAHERSWDFMRQTEDEQNRISYGQAFEDGVNSVKRLDIEAIARTCHAVNRAYSRSIGDNSHEPWETAPDWQKDSAIKGVNAALGGVTDEELHQLWCDQKHQDGWIYGEVKDAEKKTHPCLVPYEKLPFEQRVKDTLFRTVVESLKPLV